MAVYSSGTQGGKGLLSPKYDRYVSNKIFTDTTLNAFTECYFKRVTGPQRITLTYKDGSASEPSWSFSIKGGSNILCNQVLPLYENDNDYQIPNFVLDSQDPPERCTVTNITPLPNSNRINAFSVTDTMFGIVLELYMAPSIGIENMMVLSTTSIVLTHDIEISTTYYRSSSNLRFCGTPSSFGAPNYSTVHTKTFFNASGGVNPLDAFVALPFKRFYGIQTIVFTNLTSVYEDHFSFDVDYGIVGQGCGYMGIVSSLSNPAMVFNPLNCMVDFEFLDPIDGMALSRPCKFVVTAYDGRIYDFIFYPNSYTPTDPTIRLTATALGNVDICVDVITRRFYTV